VTLSWLAFGALAIAAATFAAWIYFRRELPIPGRKILGVARGLVLVLVLLLLFDPPVPGSRAGGLGGLDRWVLLDGSTSMEAGGEGSEPAWTASLARAQELAAEGARILLFGGTPRVVPTDSLNGLVPTERTSRLAPALARVAESGATDVTILSDLRLDDPIEASLTADRLFLELQSESGEEGIRNVGVARFELPSRAESGDTLVAQVAVFAEETGPSDSIRLEIFEEDRLVAADVVAPAGFGRLATAAISLPAPGASGWTRYRLSAGLAGDEFPWDDAKTAFVEVDPEEGGLVLVSLRPDWEPRFLLPVLSQVTGLDTRGFLAMTDGRYLRLGSGAEAGGTSDEDAVRRAALGAEFLVVHGIGRGPPGWVLEAMAAGSRTLLFPANQGGAAAAGVRAGPTLPGEWYLVRDLLPSPLAAGLAGADLTGLPPLTNILPRLGSKSGADALQLQFQGGGAAEAALVLNEDLGRRSAVMLASGFWRWAFREGPDRQVYRRLWAGVAGWLLASTPVEEGASLRPGKRVWSATEEWAWSAPGMIGDTVALRLVTDGSVAMDTTLVVDAIGEVRTPGLPVAEYTYQATHGTSGDDIGSGRVESERHSLELLRQPTALASGRQVDREGAPVRARRPGRPLRTHPLPYLLIMVLLCAEWIGRRQWGLR